MRRTEKPLLWGNLPPVPISVPNWSSVLMSSGEAELLSSSRSKRLKHCVLHLSIKDELLMDEEGKCRVESLSQSSTKHRQTDLEWLTHCLWLWVFLPLLSFSLYFHILCLTVIYFLVSVWFTHTHTSNINNSAAHKCAFPLTQHKMTFRSQTLSTQTHLALPSLSSPLHARCCLSIFRWNKGGDRGRQMIALKGTRAQFHFPQGQDIFNLHLWFAAAKETR